MLFMTINIIAMSDWLHVFWDLFILLSPYSQFCQFYQFCQLHLKWILLRGADNYGNSLKYLYKVIFHVFLSVGVTGSSFPESSKKMQPSMIFSWWKFHKVFAKTFLDFWKFQQEIPTSWKILTRNAKANAIRRE